MDSRVTVPWLERDMSKHYAKDLELRSNFTIIGLYHFQHLLASRSKVAALAEDEPQARKPCWAWAGAAGSLLGELQADPGHQGMWCLRHKVTRRQVLS